MMLGSLPSTATTTTATATTTTSTATATTTTTTAAETTAEAVDQPPTAKLSQRSKAPFNIQSKKELIYQAKSSPGHVCFISAVNNVKLGLMCQ